MSTDRLPSNDNELKSIAVWSGNGDDDGRIGKTDGRGWRQPRIQLSDDELWKNGWKERLMTASTAVAHQRGIIISLLKDSLNRGDGFFKEKNKTMRKLSAAAAACRWRGPRGEMLRQQEPHPASHSESQQCSFLWSENRNLDCTCMYTYKQSYAIVCNHIIHSYAIIYNHIQSQIIAHNYIQSYKTYNHMQSYAITDKISDAVYIANQSFLHSASHSVKQASCELISQWVIASVCQSVKQSRSRPVNQWVNQLHKPAMSKSVVSHPFSHSIIFRLK